MNVSLRSLVFNLIVFPCTLYSQNLIPNPSFEQFNTCPSSFSNLDKAAGWSSPTGASSDYFNSCTTNSDISVPSNAMGYQEPPTGYAYIGLAIYELREYALAELLDTLEAGVNYYLSFKVSMADVLKIAADGIGAYFSETPVTCSPGGTCVLNYPPQVSNSNGNVLTDTANWVEIAGTFTAQGGERYVTLGNFKTDSQTQTTVINPSSPYSSSYVFLDDVLLIADSLVSNGHVASKDLKLAFSYSSNTLSVSSSKESMIVIYNCDGKTLLRRTIESSAELDLNQLSGGIYLVRLCNSGQQLTKRIFIAR